jgi:hypothetical protein
MAVALRLAGVVGKITITSALGLGHLGLPAATGVLVSGSYCQPDIHYLTVACPDGVTNPSGLPPSRICTEPIQAVGGAVRLSHWP